jgi:ABC-type Fe3+/spermidine/putrescine transport system ATPase subunit
MKEKIKLVQIVKAYDDFSIDVDFEVHEGEFVSLLGPSGSGKTTTLHVIAGFIAPDSGIILKDEKNITETPPEKRNIGIVFQDFALFPFLTVYSNIAFGLELKRLSRKEVAAEVDKFAGSFGISSILHKYPDSISGGEKQRVALARAMITKPDILLMDEPLSSLDAKISERLRDELKDFHRKFGITIIYVTHDQIEAMYLSDRIILMNGGHIEQIGTPTEIYYSPSTSFAREFVGKINFIKFNDKTFFVRPEDIKIDIRDGDIEGQIIDIHYLGSTTEIVINSQKGTLFALDLTRNVTNFKKGDIIFLSFKQYGSS